MPKYKVTHLVNGDLTFTDIDAEKWTQVTATSVMFYTNSTDGKTINQNALVNEVFLIVEAPMVDPEAFEQLFGDAGGGNIQPMRDPYEPPAVSEPQPIMVDGRPYPKSRG